MSILRTFALLMAAIALASFGCGPTTSDSADVASDASDVDSDDADASDTDSDTDASDDADADADADGTPDEVIPDGPPPVVVPDADTGELIEKLDDPRSRAEATDALIEKGAGAVQPLVEAMKSEKPQVRAAAAFALCQIGDTAAIAPLETAEKTEEDDAAKAAMTYAIEALKQEK